MKHFTAKVNIKHSGKKDAKLTFTDFVKLLILLHVTKVVVVGNSSVLITFASGKKYVDSGNKNIVIH